MSEQIDYRIFPTTLCVNKSLRIKGSISDVYINKGICEYTFLVSGRDLPC